MRDSLISEARRELWRRRIIRARLHVGSWILGNDWYGVVTRLQLIDQRARAAITPDGQVVLAECEPLATALYGQLLGSWTLSVTQADPSDTVSRSSGRVG